MSKNTKDALFIMIQSLTKSEKRQFKLNVGKSSGNSGANFMALFNVMDKLKIYDEEIILKNTAIKKQQLSNAKAHLYKQILKSLRTVPHHQNVRMNLREQIDFATILYNKGLYKQSLKILDKSKKNALSFNENHIAYEIVELEKIIESQFITRSLQNRADNLAIQAKELSLKNVASSKLSNLSLQIYSLLLQKGYVRNVVDLEIVQKYFNDRLPKYDLKIMGFNEKLYLYQAYLLYSLVTQNFINSYKYAHKWVNLFEDNPAMKQLNPVSYLRGVNYLLESLFFNRKLNNFHLELDKLKKEMDQEIFLTNENTKVLSKMYYQHHRINSFYIKGTFKAGTLYVPEVLDYIEKSKHKIDDHHIMIYYYKIACLYFGDEQYENCILYLDKIIQNKDLSMREDLMCFARVLNLVAHYEAGLDSNLEKLIKSTYRFLIKMNELHEVQKRMILFLKRLFHIYPHEIKMAFIELYDDLKQFENHPFEKRAFLYLDILSWLESNIKEIPVSIIIQNKRNNPTK